MCDQILCIEYTSICKCVAGSIITLCNILFRAWFQCVPQEAQIPRVQLIVFDSPDPGSIDCGKKVGVIFLVPK